MRDRICIAALLLFAIFAAITSARAEDSVVPATPLLSTGTTVVGETLHYPTNGPAHVTAAIVTLAPGGKTVLHRHGVPLFAYILEGELTVDYGGTAASVPIGPATRSWRRWTCRTSAPMPARSRCAF